MAERPFRRSRRHPRHLWLLALLLGLAAPAGAAPEAERAGDSKTPVRSQSRVTVAPATLPDLPAPYLVRDLAPGPDGLGPSGLRSFGDRVLGRSFDLLETPGPSPSNWLFRGEVTVSDGTEAGTFRLLPDDITFAWWMSEAGSDRLQFFAACEAPILVYFSCSDRDTDLWRTDGTREGTFPLTEGGTLDTGSGNLFDGLYLEERGLMFFRGAEPAEGSRRSFELWVTDGTEAGTRLLADLDPEGSGFPGRMVEFDSQLYFTFRVESEDGPRWSVGRSDGTPEGTAPRPGGPTDPRAVPIDLWVGDDEVFVFYLTRAERMSLWRDDGGPDGLTQLWEETGVYSFSDLSFVGVEGSKIFFMVWTPLKNPEGTLWVSDGTAEGTRQVPPPPGTVFRYEYPSRSLVVHGERIYYRIDDGIHGSEPWVSDGTPEGTRMIADFCPGPCDSTIFGAFAEVGGRVLLSVTPGDGRRRLLALEPETGQLRDLSASCPVTCNVLWDLVTVGDLAYFTLHDGVNGREIWVSDGTVGGTRRVSDFEENDPFYQPAYARRSLRPPAAVAGGRLFFGAQDPDHGWELWAVELPEEGTEFPQRPEGEPLTTPALPGFAFWVRITPGAGEPIDGRAEPGCIPETLCVSGAVPGRAEVFGRIVGPKPNGFLWPTLVKFTTSTVEVWIEQLSTGQVRYYQLEGASPGIAELPGLFDRDGFRP